MNKYEYEPEFGWKVSLNNKYGNNSEQAKLNFKVRNRSNKERAHCHWGCGSSKFSCGLSSQLQGTVSTLDLRVQSTTKM